MNFKDIKYLIIVLILLTGCLNSNSNQEEITQIIISEERKALDEWAKGNPNEYPKHFASDATYFDDIAAQNRIEGIDEITAYFKSLEGKIPVHNYELIKSFLGMPVFFFEINNLIIFHLDTFLFEHDLHVIR